MSSTLACNVCAYAPGPSAPPAMVEIACDVRKFQHESFAVWRCERCQSIHARDEVALDHYYRDYPFHHLKLDWKLRLVYGKLLRRLHRAGLRANSSVLDYGCGSGTLAAYLRSRGHLAVGYDAYSESFQDGSLLERTYDCVIAQDVIEHVDQPLALLDELGRLVAPGGLLVIGTPDASAIDLAHPAPSVHMLHVPYHRHILSVQVLHEAARERGWEQVKHYDTAASNLLLPGFNLRFFLHYLTLFDNSLDIAFEPPRFSAKLFAPTTLFYAFFGYFFCPKADITTLFRARAPEPRAASSRRALRAASE